MFSRCLQPRTCVFLERGGFSAAPEASGKDPGDGSVLELSFGQILQKRDRRAAGLVVLAVK
jgi:hypothetical protein